MIELLRRVAAEDPDRAAILTHDESHSYGDLVAAAERVAATLTTLQSRGPTRFATADVDAGTVVGLLAGASLAGVEACQYPPEEPEVIAGLVARFGHETVVSPREDLSMASAELGAQIVSPASWQQAPGNGSSRPSADRPSGDRPSGDRPSGDRPTGDRPHLVLTTGTTGAPRGVRHDWSRLLRGTTRVRPGAGERWLLAYGLHQFAGLQIMLHVFAAGATLVAPAPRRPREGLAAMRTLGVTHASATPTYWRFLLAEMRSDGGGAPALEQITLGGEAIPGPLLDELRSAFPGAAVSQVYAASEFGSSGSVRDGRAGLSTAVLDRGDDADVDMRVIDGELWVRSRTGMLGYHGEPPVEPDAWRSTGDLVEIEGDRILFRGRTSEIINVGGVKVHPLPVEDRVSAVAGVDMARVYGRPNPMTGAIVALEVVAAPDADHDTVRAAIRAACEDLPPASRPRSIKFVDSVITAGSKIVRRPASEQ